MMTDDQSQAVWHLIRRQHNPMLCFAQRSKVQVIPVSLVQNSFDGTLWFPVSAAEFLSRGLRANDPVCVSCRCDSPAFEVCLFGTADYVTDQELLSRLCPRLPTELQPGPQMAGAEHREPVLLEVRISRVETWDLALHSHRLLFMESENTQPLRQ